MVWCQYVGTSVRPADLKAAIWQLHPPSPLDERIQNFYLIVCTLLALWRGHWKTIFDGVPLRPTTAFDQACVLIDMAIDEHVWLSLC